MEHSVSPPDKRNLYTVNETVMLPEFSYLTRSSLRHLINDSKPRFSASGSQVGGNGMVEAGVLIRIGRKILIDINCLRNWTASQRERIGT